MIYLGSLLQLFLVDCCSSNLDVLRMPPQSSGVAKLGHTGVRAPATTGCTPPTAAMLANY